MSANESKSGCSCCSRLSRLVRGNSVRPTPHDIITVEPQKPQLVKASANGTTTYKVYQNDAALKMDKSELEEQFKIVDVNKDGFIDADELKKVMRSLGMKYSEEEIVMMLEQADANGSGKIEEDDFMKIMSEYLDSEKEESFDIRDLFDFFDSDKDGFISQHELQRAVKELLQDTVSTKGNYNYDEAGM